MTCENKTPQINKNSMGHCAQDIGCAIAQAVPIIGSAQIKILEKVAGKKFTSSIFGKNCTGNDSCITQAASAIIKGLWGTLSGLWDLAKMAGDYVVSKSTDFWNWATGSKVENESSKRIHKMSQQLNSTFNEFKKDPFGFIGNMVKGLMNGITEFMTNDIFCMKWSGIPRASKCIKPLPSLGCMDCKTLINGSCAAVGYIAEKIGESLTGSWLAGAAGGVAKNISAGVMNMLKSSAKAGKLAKVEASMMKAMPKLTEAVKDASKASYELGKKGVQIADKGISKAKSGLKWIHGETIGKSIDKIKNLTLVKTISNSKIVIKGESLTRQFVNLNEKAYQHGFKTSLKTSSPKISLTSLAKPIEKVSNKVEVEIVKQGLSKEEKVKKYISQKVDEAEDIPYEEIKPVVKQKLIGDGGRSDQKLIGNSQARTSAPASTVNSKATIDHEFDPLDQVNIKHENGTQSAAKIFRVHEDDGSGNKLVTVFFEKDGKTVYKTVSTSDLDLVEKVKVPPPKKAPSNIVKIDNEFNAVDISELNDNSKLNKMAKSVKEKMGVDIVYSKQANDNRNSGGFSTNGIKKEYESGETSRGKLINISEDGYKSRKPGGTEFHEIGHAQTTVNIEKNIKDPMAVQFFPKNLNKSKDIYSDYAKADDDLAGLNRSRLYVIIGLNKEQLWPERSILQKKLFST